MHMLRKARAMRGYTVRAKEGEVGTVVDHYFDEPTWTVRYLAVETVARLGKGVVLTSPIGVRRIDDESLLLELNIEEAHVTNAPAADLSLPVARRFEEVFHRYHGWPVYWDGEERWGAYAFPMDLRLPGRASDIPSWAAVGENESCIRSLHSMEAFQVQARDGRIGLAEDFIIDDESWAVRYIVVDTREWMEGRRLLLSPHWLERVGWEEKTVFADVLQETVRQAPVYDPASCITRKFEHRLFRHYAREEDWDSVPVGRKPAAAGREMNNHG